MVGTRRTNSCDTCRKRRVKCDEVRPVCGQCAKKGRECEESAPPNLNWVKSGQLCILPSDTNPGEPIGVLEQEFQELTLVKSAPASNGGTFHKYRIRPVSRRKQAGLSSVDHVPQAVSLSSIDRLRHAFSVASMECPVGHRLSAFNSRINDVPRYLGHSLTLDQAAMCIIYSHRALLMPDSQCKTDSKVYHRALKTLQNSLNDPLQVSQSTTLCAVSLLGCAELLGMRFLNWNYITHASGLAALIKAHGKAAARDGLGKSVLYGAVGSIIVDCIMKGTYCFMNEPEWHWLFETWPTTSPVQAAHRAVLLQLSSLTDLLIDIRSACSYNNSLINPETLVSRILAVQEGIRRAREDMYLALDWRPSSTSLIELGAIPPDVSYRFKDPDSARVMLQCWAVVVHVNNAMADLHSFFPDWHMEPFTELSMMAMQLESRRHAEDICRSVEYARQFVPVESLYMSYPMMCTWSVLPDAREWIVTELNNLNGGLMSNFNDVIMDYISKRLLGCAALGYDPLAT